jgi:hypothetical protein
MGPIRCPETSVKDYHSTLRNTPEERRSHQHRARKHGPNICLEKIEVMLLLVTINCRLSVTYQHFFVQSSEICAILGFYAMLSGSSVPTFRDNLSFPFSRAKKFKKTF